MSPLEIIRAGRPQSPADCSSALSRGRDIFEGTILTWSTKRPLPAVRAWKMRSKIYSTARRKFEAIEARRCTCWSWCWKRKPRGIGGRP